MAIPFSEFARGYQKEAVHAAWGAYQANKYRAHVEMATALGKSWTAWWFAQMWLRDNPDKRMIGLVDKVDPTHQNHVTFKEVCGDEFTVGVHYSDKSENLDARVLFTTFLSVPGLIARGDIDPDDFGLVFVDESHHAPAPNYLASLGYFAHAFFYATSATIERMDGLDPNEIFGKPVFSYPLYLALREGKWLAAVEYHMLTDNISIRALRRLMREVMQQGERRVSRKRINRDIFLEAEIESVVEEVEKYHAMGFRKTVIFCNSIEHTLQAQRYFAGSEAYYYCQERPRGEPSPLDRFRNGDIEIICVVDKLNEAIDIPDAELIVFWRSTASKRIWLQQLGRGLRRTRTKKKVVALDFVVNVNRILWLKKLQEEVGGPVGPGPHGGEGDDPIVVGSELFQVDFSDELLDLLKILELLHEDFYETIEEAMEAVQKLNPPWKGSLKDWYAANYDQDPRLPSSPWTVYASKWIGIAHFCGRDFYETIEEAMEAVQKLNPPWKSLRGWYADNYQRDPRLHSNPWTLYASDWVSLAHFCGRMPYQTIEEAMEAVQKLDPPWEKLTAWYRANYKRDPRLPSTPNEAYKDKGWKGIKHFCGRDFYETIEEAMEAVQKLDPPWLTDSSWRQSVAHWYRANRPRDSQLRSDPEQHYSGWKGWRHFCGWDYYSTIPEVTAAIQRLNPPWLIDPGWDGVLADWYKANYKRDGRLHSNPDIYYKKNGWKGLAHCCGRKGQKK